MRSVKVKARTRKAPKKGAKKIVNKRKKRVSGDSINYLSKRTLVRAVTKATKNKSEHALETLGYIIRMEGHWLVREEKSGKITRIRKIPRITVSRSEIG